MRRVQNLGWAKFPQKNLMPGQKVPKNLMTGQVFITFRVPKLKIFSKLFTFFTLTKYYTFFVKNCQKPNARAKFTSQNLMPGQKLTPEIPNVRAGTSVPTFIRESPPGTRALFRPDLIPSCLAFNRINIIDVSFLNGFQ